MTTAIKEGHHPAATFHVEKPSEIEQPPRTRYVALVALVVVAAALAAVILSLSA